MRDPVTGTFSRSYLEANLERRLAALNVGSGESLTLLLLELEGVPAVVDVLGDEAGDALLRLAGERLLSGTRDEDLVARLGGDQFCVVPMGSSETKAVEALVGRLLALLERAYLIDGQRVHVGVTAGVALAPRHGQARQELMREAEARLRFEPATMHGLLAALRPAPLQLVESLS